MARTVRLCKGQIVKVEFLDHCEGGSTPIACVVYGEVGQIDRRSLCIDYWAYADKRKAYDANEERCTILRAAIVKITRLVPLCLCACLLAGCAAARGQTYAPSAGNYCPLPAPCAPVLPQGFQTLPAGGRPVGNYPAAPAASPQAAAPAVQTPVSGETYGRLDGLWQRVQAIDEDRGKLGDRLTTLEARVEDLDGKAGDAVLWIQGELKVLRGELPQAARRVAEIEGKVEKLKSLGDQVPQALGRVAEVETKITAAARIEQVREIATAAASKIVAAKLGAAVAGATAAPAGGSTIFGLFLAAGIPTAAAGALATLLPPVGAALLGGAAAWLLTRGLRKGIKRLESELQRRRAEGRDQRSGGRDQQAAAATSAEKASETAGGCAAEKLSTDAASPSVAKPTARPAEPMELPRLPVDYAKIWAEHVQANGGNIRHEAIRYGLYKEAVELLRNGQLALPRQVDGATIAEAIEQWVLKEFVSKVSTNFPDENLHQAALQGFLYREAVIRLREGEFRVDGAKAAADAIDNWVRREFVKRIAQPVNPNPK